MTCLSIHMGELTLTLREEYITCVSIHSACSRVDIHLEQEALSDLCVCRSSDNPTALQCRSTKRAISQLRESTAAVTAIRLKHKAVLLRLSMQTTEEQPRFFQQLD